MQRTTILLAGVLATIASAGTIADAQAGSSPAHAGRATEVELHHTSLGSILTNSSGFTLYEFSRDHGSVDSCAKIHGCLQAWPALKTSGRPSAGPGVKSSLLSSVRIAGGVSQVTYAGHPLYTFSEDSRGATDYVGVEEFGGTWDAVGSSGQTVK
jgi:predicted lipoprotein with Yx(FWY)xxD motif